MRDTANGAEATVGLSLVSLAVAILLHHDSSQQSAAQHEQEIEQNWQQHKETQQTNSRTVQSNANQHKELVASIEELTSQITAKPVIPDQYGLDLRPNVFVNPPQANQINAEQNAYGKLVFATTDSRSNSRNQSLTLTNVGNTATATLSMTWEFDSGKEFSPTLPNVLNQGEKFSIFELPAMNKHSVTTGNIVIKFTNYLGFHGKNTHPFWLKACDDHFHLKIESASLIAWHGPSKEARLTN